MNNDKISAIEKIITVKIIQEDVETIYALLKGEHDPIFSLIMIPYYALFIQSCQEYMKDTFLEEPSQTIIRNARNYLKKYAEGFEKTKNEISRVDEEHDQHFRELLDYRFMKNWNIHYNIGTYWTKDRKIIGNTQLIAAYLGIEDFCELENENIYKKLGYQIGAFVNSVRIGLSGVIKADKTINLYSEEAIARYADLNTNLIDKYTMDVKDKEMAILFLNFLCSLNFLQYMLKPMFDNENNWLLRAEYITTYYCYRALIRYNNYRNSSHMLQKSDAISGLIESGKDLFCSDFRNCMMHYNLENKNILKNEYLEKPFYGIVESCFAGYTYCEYRKSLSAYQTELISYFDRHFCFDEVQIKAL